MKTLKISFPYLKYLLIPALVFLVAGIVAGSLTQTWTPLYIGLILLGETLLIIWLLHQWQTHQGFWRKRSTKAGTNAIISTLTCLVLLGLINWLTVRYTQPIDLSDNQFYTLSPQSQTLVKEIESPLKVWIFEKEPSPNDKQLLENYQRYNPKFTYEYVDPATKIGLAQQFKVKTPGEVHLEYNNKKQFVQNLLEFNQRQPLSEIKLTNSIERIRRNDTPTLYFLEGHGQPALTPQERSFSQAVESLKERGFEVKPLNLSQQPNFPQDINTLIIAGPQSKLFPQEVTLIKQYLDKGGSLLLMVDPQIDPGLDGLLKPWGLQLDPRVVIDASGRGEALGFGPATVIITNYGNHPITQALNNRYSIFPLTRPIGTVKVEGVEAVSLVVTDEKMWGESNLESAEITFDPNTDIAGPFDIGVALTRTLKKDSPDTPPKASKMVVFGNSTFATDGWFDEQFNGDIFLNSIQWLARQTDEPLSIRPRQRENRRINLTPLKARIIAWLSLLIMPLFGLTMAGITWWKRR